MQHASRFVYVPQQQPEAEIHADVISTVSPITLI
jgi:hypothetical protein